MTCPSAKVVNIHENASMDDLAGQFGLTRIRISSQRLTTNEKQEFVVPARVVQFVFVVQGAGQLAVGSNSAMINEWDCFGFPATKDERKFEISASTAGIQIIKFTDQNDRTELSEAPPAFPTIIHSRDIAKPFSKGTTFGHIAKLTRQCDIQQKDKENAWNVNLEIVPPGAKTSEAHAHSHEEEFALMLKGVARYWHHGQVPCPSLQPGDCVGWKSGTGIAHNLINDGEHHNEEGPAFYYLIYGEEKPDTDRCWYPDYPAKPTHWKDGRPEIPWGGASKEPLYPRPDELAE